MVGGKLRMEHYAHQPTFSGRLNIGNSKQRRLSKLAIFINTDSTYSLCKKHPAIGCPDNRPGHLKIANDSLDSKTYLIVRQRLSWFGLLLRGLHFAGSPAWRWMSTRQRKQ